MSACIAQPTATAAIAGWRERQSDDKVESAGHQHSLPHDVDTTRGRRTEIDPARKQDGQTVLGDNLSENHARREHERSQRVRRPMLN